MLLTLPVLAYGQAPVINAGGIVNGATFGARAVAPGSFVSVLGSNFATATFAAPSLPLPTLLGGASVQFNGTAVPLFRVTPNQINLQVPWEMAGQTQATVVVVANEVASAPQTVEIAPFDPGIFTQAQRNSGYIGVTNGTGAGEIRHGSDFQLITSTNPALRGETVVINTNGLGPASNQPASGFAAPSNPLAVTTSVPAVTIGGVPGTVTFSGLFPNFVSWYQVNVQVPTNAPTGSDLPVVLTIGGLSSNTVTMAVQDGTVSAASAAGPPGATVGIPISLALNQGVTIDTLSFGLTVTPIGNAPALTGALSFVKATALPDPITGPGAGDIAVSWLSGFSLSGANNSLGEVRVTLPPSASDGQTYAVHLTTVSATTGGGATSVSLAAGADTTLTVAATYLVGDVFPLLTDLNGDGDRDDAGEFGDGLLNNLDLIQALRAVVNLSRPPECSDRFDAMDSFLVDTADARGGDAQLNNLDLIRTLRRVVNLDTSRPVRVSRSLCAPPSLPDLSLTKTDSPDPATSGGPLTYTLRVQNIGTVAADNVTVTDPLPAGLTSVLCTASVETCSISGGTATASLGTLAASASVTVTITATAPSVTLPTLLTNTATVSTSNPESNTANNQASATTTVGPVSIGQVAGTFGAPVQAIAIDPVLPTILYAGAAGSGVFKSTDGGANWSAFNSAGLANTNIRALAVDRAGNVYAGTSGGVFKSPGGAANWTAFNSAGLTNTNIRAVALDAAGNIFAGTESSGVFKSPTESATWAAFNVSLTNTNIRALAFDAVGNIYAGTFGGGVFKGPAASANWLAFNTGLADLYVLALALDSAGNIYAGTAGGGVRKSPTSAANWTPMNSGLLNTYISTLAVDPATPTTLYAGAAGSQIGFVQGVFKSINGGASWTTVNTWLANQFVNALAINPVAPATLYAGTAAGFFKSANAGGSWSASNFGLIAPIVQALVIDPASTTTVYAATFSGGVFKSTNGSTTWTAANSGLTNTDVHALAINPATPSTIYAGTFPGGVFKSTDGGASWTPANNGLTNNRILALAINPLTPATLYAGTEAGVFKSTNAGASWTVMNNGLTATAIEALAVDPVNPSTIYAGTRGIFLFDAGVFKSTDGGANWAPVNSGLTNRRITSLAVNPSSPATLYAGTEGGGVFKSANGGGTWAAANSGLANLSVGALAVDPALPTKLYAGTTGGGVFKSADAGGSWTTSLPNASVFSLAIDPTTPATVYAGTGGGVFKSADGGTTWLPSGAF